MIVSFVMFLSSTCNTQQIFFMHDNRLTTRLIDYWNRIRKNDEIPDFKRNNPTSIADLWERCFVLYIIPPNYSAYRYEYIGEKIQEIYGRDITGTFVDAKNRMSINDVIIPRLQTVKTLIEIKTPQEDSGQLPTRNGKFIKYRIVLLPFGNSEGVVTHILIGVSYSEF